MKKKRPILRIIITILVVAGSFALIAMVLTNNKKENEAKTALVSQASGDVVVKTDKAQKLAINIDFAANGNFEPYQEMEVASESAGRVVKVLVKEGSYVKVGQTLAIVDVGALDVDLSSAQANLQNALREQERFENAFKTGGVTQQQLDQTKLAVENAQARVAQAGIRVADANVRATISGTINKRFIEPGAYVSPGTKLFELVNVSRLKLSVPVNENQVAQLKEGDEVSIKASVFPDKSYSGRVSFIAAKADAALNFPVEIEIAANPGNQIRAGMYGTAIFKFPPQEATIVVPRTAFAGSVSSNEVFVVDTQNIVRTRKVIAGSIRGDKVQILDGLSEGETVVISGQINLTDGSKIAIIQ